MRASCGVIGIMFAFMWCITHSVPISTITVMRAGRENRRSRAARLGASSGITAKPNGSRLPWGVVKKSRGSLLGVPSLLISTAWGKVVPASRHWPTRPRVTLDMLTSSRIGSPVAEVRARHGVVPARIVSADRTPELRAACMAAGIGQGRRIGFFPGSTIGNLERDEAIAFLTAARGLLGPDALFILGVDLVKAPETLIAAYDGFFGPGTGSFFMIGFVMLAGFGVLKATAHTKTLNFASNIGSLLVFIPSGATWWAVGIAMALAQVAGASLGARLAMRVGSRLIKPLLVVTSSAMAARLLWQVWAG